MVASWWRDLLVMTHGGDDLRINADFASTLDRHAGRFSPIQLRHSLGVIMQTKYLIERNANIDLALERMWMAILG